MEASELRVGNFVDIIDRTREVHLPIGAVVRVLKVGHGCDVEFCRPDEIAAQIEEWRKEPLRNLCGIPITEAWLKKFGFGDSDEHECGHNTHISFGFYYDWHFKRLQLDTGDDQVYIPHIKYVHQLQNLYFALTGEELLRPISISEQSIES